MGLKISENCIRPAVSDAEIIRMILDRVGHPEPLRDEVAAAAREIWTDAFVYRGGHHVAVHPRPKYSGFGDRILIVSDDLQDWN